MFKKPFVAVFVAVIGVSVCSALGVDQPTFEPDPLVSLINTALEGGESVDYEGMLEAAYETASTVESRSSYPVATGTWFNLNHEGWHVPYPCPR